ncbi:MAG: hypothetical protein KAI47_27930 [Deltaproteobacteria bacterium]|nr:hypothetical protein [Deltaproteobacteria bacterium]
MASTDLASQIVALAEPSSYPCLFLGRATFAHRLWPHLPSLILIEQRLKARRLARRRAGLSALRADRGQLPFATACAGTVIAMDILKSGDAATLLADWHRCIIHGGRLIVSETLRGAAGHALHSFGRGLQRFAAEDLTALFLNAGFTEIAQHWPPGGAMITIGRVHRLPMVPADNAPDDDMQETAAINSDAGTGPDSHGR